MADYTIFQIGDNIQAYVEYFGNYDTNITLYGNGAMFDDVSNFKVISSTVNPLYQDWQYCVDCLNYTLIIPDGITTIADNYFNLFSYEGSCKAVYIGKDVKKIGNRAFYASNYDGGFSEIVNIEISPDAKIESIGDEAFSGLINLESIDFHGTPTVIGSGCFMWCKKVKSLNLSTKIDIIPARAFSHCQSLVWFNKGNNINNIELSNNSHANGIFNDCRCIEQFIISNNFELDTSIVDELFKLDLNTGSNCNKDGLQITKIKTNNVSVIAYDWINKSNRYPVFESGLPFIALNHLGHTVLINGYDSEVGKLPVNHNGYILWLKLVDEDDNDKSPLVVKTQHGIKYIGN